MIGTATRTFSADPTFAPTGVGADRLDGEGREQARRGAGPASARESESLSPGAAPSCTVLPPPTCTSSL